MDARAAALAVGVALVVLLFVWLQRDLSRLRAPWRAHAVAALAYAAMAAGWAAVFLAGWPTWVGWLGSVAAIAATVAPRALARIAGPPAGPGPLLAEVGRLQVAMSTLTTSRRARTRLRSRARELDRWRTESGSEPLDELIDLVQQLVYVRLSELPRDPDREQARERRIEELVSDLER
jgi:hypothetical protein